MEYYKSIGRVELGNLDKVTAFLSTLNESIHKLDHYPTNCEIHTDLDLNYGSDLVCMRYGKHNGFYTLKGKALAELFDDWLSVQKWVEVSVGPVANDYPLITFTKNHLFKHTDLKRSATVNMGLYNSTDSNTVFWDNDSNIVASVRYGVGEAILANVSVNHSIILNDGISHLRPRAILMWTVLDTYDNASKISI